MADRVFLHIGTPKSGTTYLQETLWQNRRALARTGVTYPAWAPDAHFHACMDLLGAGLNGWRDPESVGAWPRLLRRVHGRGGTAVLSHELFGDARPEVAARALAELAPAEVDVVVTARDLARQLPAVWQEDVKNRHVQSFADFLHAADAPTGDGGEQAAAFWWRHDVPEVLRRWTAGLPPERVHVVTVPPAGADRDLLWRRFAALVGADPGLAGAPATPAVVNRSMGPVEAEFLRRLNGHLDGCVEWPVYAERVTRYLAPEVLASRSAGPVLLPAHARPWVARRSRAQVEALVAAGVHVVGDPADLLVRETGGNPCRAAAEVPDEEVLDVAFDAVTGLILAGELNPAPTLAERVGRKLARVVDRHRGTLPLRSLSLRPGRRRGAVRP